MFRVSPFALFKTVSVWGGGIMGSGIAQVCAQAGLPTTVIAASGDNARLQGTRKGIEKSLARIAAKKHAGDEAAAKAFVENILSNITFTTDPQQAAQSEVIIEAVKEDVNLKKELFTKLDTMAPKETVFFTNTSSFSVADLASVTKRAERFGGLHFFSPVPMMKLAEVVQTDSLSPAVLDDAFSFCKKIGKVPIRVSDTEGFVVNRLFVPYLGEAWRLAERGVASYDDIDTAMKLGCGYPMGPFELSDMIGIDTLVAILDGWHQTFPEDPLFHPVKSVNALVAAGKHGRKTGEGFYKYDSKGKRVN